MAEKAKKTAAKKAPAKKSAPKRAEPKKKSQNDYVTELLEAMLAARLNGVAIKASIAWIDDEGNTQERSI